MPILAVVKSVGVQVGVSHVWVVTAVIPILIIGTSVFWFGYGAIVIGMVRVMIISHNADLAVVIALMKVK